MNDAEAVPIDGCVGGPCLGARFPQVYEVNMRAIKKELGIDAHKIQYVYIQLGIYPAL